MFYAGRFISDQAPKGDPDWGYDLKEIYVICLLADFSLPNSNPDTYQYHIALNYKETGEPFYDKLEFIYLEVEKFKKEEDELSTALDQWIYAMKYAEEMKEVPPFLNAPQLDKFFYLAKYSNLTKEERDMYRTKEDVIRDNRNVSNFAWGREEGAIAEKKEIAKRLKAKGIDLKIIASATELSIDEIIAL